MTEMSAQNLFDGLHRYQSELERDFCFRDIIPEIKKDIPKKLFTELTLTKEEKLKVEKLFSYFIYTKKDVEPFLRILKRNYKWIYEDVLNSKHDKWIQDYRKAIQDIPNNSDWNVHRIHYLMNIQQYLKDKATDSIKKYLILFGKLGFGKKWLAADAIRHYGIVSRMNFRIFWLNVSKCCTQELILEKMHRLKVMIQADEFDMKFNAYNGNTKNQIVHLRNHLRKLLEKPQFRDSLVVLVDVQDENICKAFYELPCKFLITTRHIERLEFIPQEHKTMIEINEGFNTEETQELFRKAFDNCVLPNDMTKYVNNFHTTCNGHPFILSLIAKSFQHFKESQSEREKRSENWIKSLNEYELHDREDLIKMSMVKSMSFLKEEYQKYYKMMVIFTDNRDVPFGVLEKFWNKNSQETEAIVVKLQKYSLLESRLSEQNKKICSLHYLHFHFLLQEVHEQDQITYHQQLIDRYGIDKIIKERKDLNLDFPRDNYFHYFIPYHLVGANRKDLFKLYFDFDFLEQKMRFTRLTNTVGDLQRFAEFIVGNHRDREEFLNELVMFLPNSEQQLYESNDVNLLQLALNSSGLLQKEAKRQIGNFPDRVWMEDINHGEQTQIVQIYANSQPQIVRFVKPNNDVVCLIALKDSNILLQHIVHNYHNVALLYKNEQQSQIIDLQGFRDQHFLSLTKNGKLCVYPLKSVSMRQNTLPLPILVRSNSINENLMQRIDSGNQEEITCFVITNDEVSQVDLIVGLSNGNLRFFSWRNNKFEEDKKLMIKSKFINLHRFVKVELGDENVSNSIETEGNSISSIYHEYLMLMNQYGDIRFVDLKSSGEMATCVEWKKLDHPINLHQGECKISKQRLTVCVGRNKVVQVTHKRILFNGVVIEIDINEMYATDSDHEILSSAMSKDTKYVILGTTKGIFVFNRMDREVVMRKNISDRVLSLDVFHDDDAMYILSSIFEDSENVISLHGFDEKSEDWNKLMPILAGGDLFDVKQNSKLWEMIAFDDQKNIQFRSSTDNFDKAIMNKTSYYDIKKLIYADDKIIIGCTNGSIMKIDSMGKQHPICSLACEITYLELVEGIIISSCNSEYIIIDLEKKKHLKYAGKITKAYHYGDHQLLLVRKNCSVEILNTLTGDKVEKALTNNEDEYCTSQAFSSQQVFVASSKKNVYIWNFEEMSAVKRVNFDDNSSAEITALAVSMDKSILAVGSANGCIEIFDLLQWRKVKQLSSAHGERRKKGQEINNLYFSPWQSSNEPMILLSVSSSICFWNIKTVQTEMFHKISTTNEIRVSNRFRHVKSSPDSKLSEATEKMTINHLSPWGDKSGSTKRPELLSCHKLIGKSAKKVIINDEFDEFVTIDNEGNIYYLRLVTETFNTTNNLINSFDYNGNPMQ